MSKFRPSASRMPIVFVIIMMVFVCGVVWVVWGLDTPAISQPEFIPLATASPVTTKAAKSPAQIRATLPAGTPSPTVPDYRATNQALESTQQALDNQMHTATAEAEYYAIMLIKSEVENKIEDLEFEQRQSHTATVEAAAAIATMEEDSRQIQLAIEETVLEREQDATQTEIERNDADLERYNQFWNMIAVIGKICIVAIGIMLCVFVGLILDKARKNQQWDMDREQEAAKAQSVKQTAQAVSAILAHETRERYLVSKLVDAVGKVGGIQDSQVPRFDKIKDWISQPERDKAVSVLVKYKYCDPVRQGVATQLINGVFSDLQNDLESGEFPPTTIASRRIKKVYAQQSTPVNSQEQPSTVERLGEGVYRGN